MNRYEKKRGYTKVLLEFESVRLILGVIIVVATAVAVTFVGHLLLMTPLRQVLELEDLANEPWIICRFFEFLIGFFAFLFGSPIVMEIINIPSKIKDIRTNLHAAKIMQYLPLKEEDWEKWNVKTNKEAIQTLRELVHSFGYTEDFYYCEALRNNIWHSYHSFLKSVYGDDSDGRIWNELASIENIILCTDDDFKRILQRSLDMRENLRREWEQKYGAILKPVKRNADTSV